MTRSQTPSQPSEPGTGPRATPTPPSPQTASQEALRLERAVMDWRLQHGGEFPSLWDIFGLLRRMGWSRP